MFNVPPTLITIFYKLRHGEFDASQRWTVQGSYRKPWNVIQLSLDGYYFIQYKL